MNILCEISLRHVHLCAADVETLWGKGAKLQFERELSQPNQFLSKQRLTLVGPKREIADVAVLGGLRDVSQVELALSDAYYLGIKDVPVRLSGDLENTPGITLKSETGATVKLKSGVIVAKRHVHLDPTSAKKLGFNHGETVKIAFNGERSAILDGVSVRIDASFAPAVHLDSDEGNAVLASPRAEIFA